MKREEQVSEGDFEETATRGRPCQYWPEQLVRKQIAFQLLKGIVKIFEFKSWVRMHFTGLILVQRKGEEAAGVIDPGVGVRVKDV